MLSPVLSEIPISRALKEGESYKLKTLISFQIGDKKTIWDVTAEHKCVEVNSHGIQDIEETYTDGTRQVNGGEKESAKGEVLGYRQNSFGQRFDEEEDKATLQSDPLAFFMQEVHMKLKDHTVVVGETWNDKTANTEYKVTAGQIKKFNGEECIQVTRKGTFTNGVTGTFKVDEWFRTKDGQVMYREINADDVVLPDVPVVHYLERSEFLKE